MPNTKESTETLIAIAGGAATCEELATKLGIPYSSATGRVRRLLADKQIIQTGYGPSMRRTFGVVGELGADGSVSLP